MALGSFSAAPVGSKDNARRSYAGFVYDVFNHHLTSGVMILFDGFRREEGWLDAVVTVEEDGHSVSPSIVRSVEEIRMEMLDASFDTSGTRNK